MADNADIDPPREDLGQPVGCLPPGIAEHNWNWFVLRGVLALLLGAAALFLPGATLFAFTLVFAAFCFADGVAMLVAGMRRASFTTPRWWAMIVSGLAGVAIGVLFVIWPLASVLAYSLLIVLLVAAWALATGVLEVAAAIRLRKEIEGEWLLALSGAFSLALGTVLLWLVFANPGITILSVAWLIAFYAIASGIALLVLGWRLKKRREKSNDKI